MQFACERWSLAERSPQYLGSQVLQVRGSSWRLYDQPLAASSNRPNGRPTPVSFTPDLGYLRIGSALFGLTDAQKYEPVQISTGQITYFDEFDSRGSYVATSCRRMMSVDDLIGDGSSAIVPEDQVHDFSKDLHQMLEEGLKSVSGTESTNPTSQSQSRKDGT